MLNIKRWRTLTRNLREQFPMDCHVEVRRRPLKKECGNTIYDGRKYVIAVDSSQDWDGQVDTLVHEWAHVLAIESSYRHSDEWGVFYAKVFEVIDNIPTQPKRRVG